MEESIHVIIFLAFQSRHKSKRRLLNNSLQAPSENRPGNVSSPNHAKEKENCSYFPFSSPFIISPSRFPPCSRLSVHANRVSPIQPSFLSFPRKFCMTPESHKMEAKKNMRFKRQVTSAKYGTGITPRGRHETFFAYPLFSNNSFFLLCFHSSFPFICRPLTVRTNVGELHSVCV